MTTKTELHTHLMGMLSSRRFLELINKFTDEIYWPIDQPITTESPKISIDKLLKSNLYDDALRIKQGDSVSYDKLDNFYHTRTELLKYAVYICEKIFDDKIKAESLVYSVYINECLQELIKQGVEYTEISYSIPRIINNIVIDEKISEQIKCKFLLSTDRTRSLRDFKNSSKDLKKLLENGIACGFDIMGQEIAFTDEEKDSTNDTKKSQSFKRKLEVLIDCMNQYENSTLRIHSGETKLSLDNTELTLNYIKELKEEKGIVIPPPEIRIGHGIYFKRSEEYLNLLKEFNSIVEINASSNLSLGNIESYDILPYDYYLTNGVKVVVSTDGHGLYDTNIPYENKIAQMISENYDQIPIIDDEVRSNK